MVQFFSFSPFLIPFFLSFLVCPSSFLPHNTPSLHRRQPVGTCRSFFFFPSTAQMTHTETRKKKHNAAIIPQ
ncbi:hypothetical protein GLYMA_02G028850v4 [Glycine max]|nr:hypothetical protein GLYMA_02G028850v4 [Glycine max]KAH1058451.1 hypothetical protein GYH30_002841 [Glycine max]